MSRRQPTPRTSPSSQLLFVNGLGFEGWMDRLEKSSGFNGKVVVASTGVKPRTMVEEEGGTPETITDPHAWQDLGNGKLYVDQYPRRADRRRSGRQSRV